MVLQTRWSYLTLTLDKRIQAHIFLWMLSYWGVTNLTPLSADVEKNPVNSCTIVSTVMSELGIT